MMTISDAIIDQAGGGQGLDDAQAMALATHDDLGPLMEAARARRDLAHGNRISYSPKVFIPLTQLCRDICRYCTFAHTPRELTSPYLSVDDAVQVAAAGARAGCREALFTLGDRPESRYRWPGKRWRSWDTIPPWTISPMWRGGCMKPPGCCPM